MAFLVSALEVILYVHRDCVVSNAPEAENMPPSEAGRPITSQCSPPCIRSLLLAALKQARSLPRVDPTLHDPSFPTITHPQYFLGGPQYTVVCREQARSLPGAGAAHHEGSVSQGLGGHGHIRYPCFDLLCGCVTAQYLAT